MPGPLKVVEFSSCSLLLSSLLPPLYQLLILLHFLTTQYDSDRVLVPTPTIYIFFTNSPDIVSSPLEIVSFPYYSPTPDMAFSALL